MAGSRTRAVYQRLVVVMLFGVLAFGSASAQQAGTRAESARADGPTQSQAGSARSLRLKGVLISGSRRTALVDGQPAHEGGRVGGAEILEIEQRSIRVRVGSRELSVGVGDSFAAGASVDDTERIARQPMRPSQDQERPALRSAAPQQDGTVANTDAYRRHTVTAGETLSGIALRFLRDGATMDQMMIGLFDSNQHAFNDNINLLYAGALLRIPNEPELRRQSPATATAEVVRQVTAWEASVEQNALLIRREDTIMASANVAVDPLH